MISFSPMMSNAASTSWTANTGICNSVCDAATLAKTLGTYGYLGGLSTTIHKVINFSHSVTNGIMPTNSTVTVGESMILTENSTSGSWFTTGGLNDSPVADGLLHWQAGDNNQKYYFGVSQPTDSAWVNISSNNPGVLECSPGWGCTARSPGYATVTVTFPAAARGVAHKLIGDNIGFGIINILSESWKYSGVSPCPKCGLVYTWNLMTAAKVSRVFSFPPIYYGVTVNAKPNVAQNVVCTGATNISRNNATINWSYSDNDGDIQTNYHTQVATDPGFTNVIWQIGYTGGDVTWLRSVNVPAGTLAAGTTYYMRTAGYNNINGWGPGFVNCSAGFTTVPNSVQTVACHGMTNVTTNSATFNWGYWDPEGDAQSNYHFQMATDPNFVNVVWQAAASWGNAVMNNAMTGTGGAIGIPAGVMVSNVIYYTRIASYNNTNGWGNGFVNCGTTEAIPPPPTNLKAVCNYNGTQATISWNIPSGYSSSYFRAYNTTLYPVYNDANLIRSEDYRSLSYILNTTPGHNYSTWVHTKDLNPNGGRDYSEAMGIGFTCNQAPIPPKPISITATCAADAKSAKISWVNAPGFTNVYFRLYDNTAYPVWSDSNISPRNDNYVGSSYVVNTIPGHSYGSWIHTKDTRITVGQDHSDAIGVNFTCNIASPPKPIDVAGSCTLDGTRANFSWKYPTGYQEVRFHAVDQTLYPTVLAINRDTSPEDFLKPSLSGLNYSFASIPGHKYIWDIRTKDTVNSLESTPALGSFTCPLTGQGVCGTVNKNTCLTPLVATNTTESLTRYTWYCPSSVGSNIPDTFCPLYKIPGGGDGTPLGTTTIKITKSPLITLNKGGDCTISWEIKNITRDMICNINGVLINQAVGSQKFEGLTSNTKYTITCQDPLATPPVNVSASTICRVNPTTGEI